MGGVLCPVLCGRDDELRSLRAALAGAAAGRGGLVFVTGEPGIGKSRLVRELVGQAGDLGVRAVTGRAVPAESSTPYRPLTEALLRILRDRPLPADTGLVPWLPALRAILPGIGTENNMDNADSSSVARAEAVIRLIRLLKPPGGLLIILEDLHWADPDTLAVIEYLADNVTDEPVLCVATCRSEPPSPAVELARRLDTRRGARRISLNRLDDDEIAQMVQACLADPDDQLVARVQRAAEGVPFLVEEVLASPGVPESFTEMVRVRLDGFADDERRVVEAAAVLGRHFDWQLLAAVTGLAPDVVSGSLERAVGSQLVTVDGGAFRFRHALTREAVTAGLLPPRRQSLAASALAAVDAAHPELPGAWRDVAADIAVQAGDTERAGTLLAASGEAALDRGALATAASSLRRAAAMLTDPVARANAEGLLIGCLALAGHADEAMTVGQRLLAEAPAAGPAGPPAADIHIRLAHAAIEATRWSAAGAHVAAARHLLAADPAPERAAHISVLAAELALASDDVAHAGKLARGVIDSAAVSPDVRCEALEVIGRIARLHDLAAARRAFEQALGIADAAHLPVWRLRALHELGTIELLDSGGTRQLSRARRSAAELGAFSTAAVLDLQLAAAHDFQFDFAGSARHARRALAAGERLGMSGVQSKALLFLAEAHAMFQDRDEMERCLRQARELTPDDRFIEAFGWGGCRAMSALFRADLPGAIDAFGRAMPALSALPHAEPAMFRAVWPLVLAATGDERARDVLVQTRRTSVTVARPNRGALGYAEAILAGRRGEPGRAAELARHADADLGAGTFGHLSRLLAAEPARRDGWGEPARWLESAHADLTAKNFGALADRCRVLLEAPSPNRLVSMGVTPREADVLLLVAEGLSNKQIAARLRLSPRTVEKHVESLFRKTGATSRTMLVAVAAR